MVDVPCLAAASAARTSARLVSDFDPGTRHRGVHGYAVVRCRPRRLLRHGLHPALSAGSATMGCMCGRFAVTTDPALLAEKIQAIDESTAGGTEAEGLRRPNYNVAPTTTISTVVKRHSEPDDESTRRVRLMRWGLVPPWAKTGRRRRPGHQGPAADQRARREGHQLAGVPQLRQEQALPGADGRLVRVARREGQPRRRSTCTAPTASRCSWRACGRRGGPRARPKDSAAAAELHDHHHRRRRPAGRDPRPDAADDQRTPTGTAGSTPTHRSTRDCCAGTATWTASRSARCRGWSTASATTARS